MHCSRLALMASLTLSAALAAQAPSPLASSDQHALDRQSLRLLASQPVKTEAALVAQSFAADPYARTACSRLCAPVRAVISRSVGTEMQR
jgi:hypothetical protein